MNTRKIYPLMLCLLWLVSTAAHAYSFKSDNLYYNITSNDEVEVTYPNSKQPSSPFGKSEYQNTDMTEVTIPATVTNNSTTYKVTAIGSYAFFNYTNLTSVNFGENVTFVGGYAFRGCEGLTSLTIGAKVKSIGEYAFAYCSNLTSINLSNDLLEIGNAAFLDCAAFTSIVIPNGVTTIGEGAFNRCKGLTAIDIPNSVTEIGKGAFRECTSLTSLTISKNEKLTTIGETVFYQCSVLTEVTIPDNITTIGENAFGWTGLTSVTIPNSVVSIEQMAFYYCRSLTSVTIGSGVETMGSSAFTFCDKLEKVISLAKVAPTLEGTSVFSTSIKDQCTLYVPDGCIEAYVDWATYFKAVKELGYLTMIDDAEAALAEARDAYQTYKSLLSSDDYRDVAESLQANQTKTEELLAEIAALEAKMTKKEAAEYGETLADIKEAVEAAIEENDETALALDKFEDINKEFAEDLEKITGNINSATTLDELNKIAETIAELTTQMAKATTDLTEALETMKTTLDEIATKLNEQERALNDCAANIKGVPEMLTVTVGTAGLATYCPEYGIDFSDVTTIAAYKASVSDNRVLLNRVYTVAAGEGVLLRSINGGAVEEYLPVADDATPNAGNAFVGTLEDTTLNTVGDDGATNFILAAQSGVVGFFKAADNTTLSAGKAYLPVENYDAARPLMLVFGDTTGIIEVAPSRSANNDAIYTLGGVRVKTPGKGLYIKNSKKVVVR